MSCPPALVLHMVARRHRTLKPLVLVPRLGKLYVDLIANAAD